MTNNLARGVDVNESKTCRACGETKPLAEFHRDASRPTGRVGRCKPCVKVASAERYAATVTEEIRAKGREAARARRAAMDEAELAELRRRNLDYMARRYAERRADLLAAQANNRAGDPERFRGYARRFREANLEKVREWGRAYIAANPEKRAEIEHRRRARRLAATIGPVDLAALRSDQCGICTGPLDLSLRHPDPMSKSLDHIVPLARGGAHAQDNLQWAHLVCNLRKGAS